MAAATAFEEVEFKSRINRIQQLMLARGVDALIVDASESMAYLCGYETSLIMYRALIVPCEGDPVMVLRELDEGPFLALSCISRRIMFRDWDDPVEIVADYVKSNGYAARTIALDMQSYALTAARYERYKRLLPLARFIDMSDELMQADLIKSDAEVSLLRKAAEIADAVMRDTIAWVRTDMSPRDVQAFVSAGFFKYGADQGATGPITSGSDENFLHGIAHGDALHTGATLHVELVPKYRGYSSRVMRSIVMGKASKKQISTMEKLIEVQDRQFAAMRPGAIARDVDAVCRQGITDAGLRTTYHNVTGYTVGFYPAPPVRGANFYRSFHPAADWQIQAGMTFHAYVSAHGLALSETVLVTPTGCERLTRTERKLFVAV